MSSVYEGEESFSLEIFKQEYLSHGTTDYRESAFQLLQGNVSRITNFEYNGHQIFREKSNLTDCRQPMWKMMMKRKPGNFFIRQAH